ncbi:hypothetical protein LCGC14_0730270 [marine sediment metagenome]|uniref:Uncharacterized protein n=1 Tax=marine sediment metagenome TaxID=412755 RepID=A0A0F9QUU2_9ZZZZ
MISVEKKLEDYVNKIVEKDKNIFNAVLAISS